MAAAGEEVFRITNTRTGLGLVATSFIPRGSLILSEGPLFIINKEKHSIAAMKKVYKTLSAKEKLDIFSFNDNINDSKTLEGIITSNALPILDSTVALYKTISRINHSCRPNAHISYNNILKQAFVYAADNINEATEITIPYIDTLQKAASRKQSLKKTFYFDCQCIVCSLQTIHKSDAKRLKILQSKSDLATLFDSPNQAFNAIQSRIQDIIDEQLWSELPLAYFDGYQLCELYGDIDNAILWEDQMIRWFEILNGSQTTIPEQKRIKSSSKRYHVEFDEPIIVEN